MVTICLDFNATSPLDPEAREVFLRQLSAEFSNEGSRSHEFGTRSKQGLQKAQDQVTAVVGASRDEVIFSSGVDCDEYQRLQTPYFRLKVQPWQS